MDAESALNFASLMPLPILKDKLIVFDDMCHSCGGCILLCPEKALTEKEKVIGKVQKGFLAKWRYRREY